jgi:type IV secretory pathway VirB3-like protein
MKIFILFPFILLVRILARHDPHLFRYWDVKSMQSWRRSRTTWKAYAIGVAGWGIVLGSLCFLVRWLWSKT